MRVAFVGPSLFGAEMDYGDLEVRPPARQGDVYRAVQEGAEAIGLVDGVFGHVGAVWHKEVLYALSKGVAVLGAASIGALRAAECREYGMLPIGKIANLYCTGTLDDDAAVTLLVAPAEMGWQPLTEPYVDVIATLLTLRRRRFLSRAEFWRIADCAARIHFSARTAEQIARCAFEDDLAAVWFLDLYHRWHRSQKQKDAAELIAVLKRPALPVALSRDWTFQVSPMWEGFLAANA